MKTVLKALLAATALFPVAAQAQRADWQARGEARANRGDDGQRGDWRARRGGEARVQAQAQAQVQAPAVVQPMGQRDQARRTYGADRPDWRDRQRPDRQQMDRQRPDRQQWDRPQPGTEQLRGQRFGDRGSPAPDAQRRDWRRDADRRDDNGADAVRRYQNQRDATVRGYGQRYDDRRDWNGRDTRNWNRDWRNDRRYDWNRYRGGNRSAYRLPRYYAPPGWAYGYRRFSVGARLSSFLWDQNYWIDDPFVYRLPPAYGPYRWVRYYDDALLIDIRTGLVVDSVYGIFY